MHTNAPDAVAPNVFTNNCRLPVHSLSAQTRHIVDSQSSQVQQSQRMLSLFVLVLCLAVATVLCLLIINTPAHAAAYQLAPQLHPADGLIALGALTSLVASFTIGLALIISQFRSKTGRRAATGNR